MKILFHSADKTEIYSAKLLLAGKGIPTFIGGENSGPSLGFVNADKYTLWVCLESQYDDAISVLKYPDHEVKEPVDQIDFQDYIDLSMKDINKVLLKEIMWPAIIILCVFGIVLIYSNTA
jgi:hypothetical protein